MEFIEDVSHIGSSTLLEGDDVCVLAYQDKWLKL